MRGRIVTPDNIPQLELPEVGKIHIGKKAISKSGKEYPTSVDYFIPSGKYAGLFTKSLGEQPSTIQVIFPDDNPEKVCNVEYTYRDDMGKLVAKGDGEMFEVWNGAKRVLLSKEKYPNIMNQIASKYPNKKANNGNEGWEIELTMRFIVPAVSGIVGVWRFSSKGMASTIPNVSKSFDSVQMMRGTVTGTVFDLSVAFAKSNKPGDNSRFPVVSLVANDNSIEDIKARIQTKGNLNLLLGAKEQ